jgi:predicted negative regulator of RcsB-dependent stress response
MAVYDLQEQEQLDELKTWWQMHGNLVTGVVLAAAIGAAGWQGWNWWKRSQTAEATAIYGSLQQAAAAHDPKRSREIEGELIDKYGGTPYAAMGALLSAKIQADAGDLKNARAQLAWAAEHAFDDALRDLARLRLAGILADDNAADEALRLLATEPAAPLAARYAELRGDILAAQGKAAEARAAYEAALAKSDAERGSDATRDQSRSGYHDMLKVKLEALGGTAK